MKVLKIKERYSGIAALVFLVPLYFVISVILVVIQKFIELNSLIWLVAVLIPIMLLSKINQHVQLTCNKRYCHGDLIKKADNYRVCSQCGTEYRYDDLN